jgi:hypothetical protein
MTINLNIFSLIFFRFVENASEILLTFMGWTWQNNGMEKNNSS